MAGFVGGIVGNIAGNAATAIGERLTPKQWAGDLCGCCDDSDVCCDVFWCAPCQMARQCSAIDEKKNQLECSYCCCALLAMASLGSQFPLGPGMWAAALRYRMIEKYNIMLTLETPIWSGCYGLGCTPCSLCQTSRTLMALGEQPMGTCCVPKEPMGAGFLCPLLIPGGAVIAALTR